MNDAALHSDAQQALAEGFASQITTWAQRHGTGAVAVQVARQAARALSLATAHGHVCLRLADLQALPCEHAATMDALRRGLLDSGVVGTPQDRSARPMVLDAQGRLYLQRDFDHERRLAQRLVRAAAAPPVDVDGALRQQLDALFGPGDGHADWQKLAAALALRRRLVVISGGPGTGKTTTVVNLLACLLAQQPQARIALAAPTGKAAARMSEALRQRAAHLPQALREQLPLQATTVHRLLGAHPGGFRHDAARPLAIDVLVVDEASMLDLALARRLLDAVPDSARLVLLGDKDQLAAVESGAVFAELSADPTLGPECIAALAALSSLPAGAIVPAAPVEPSPLRDAVVWLSRNFRFGADSAIGRAAEHIRQGRSAELLAQLNESADPSLLWLDDGGTAPSAATLQRLLRGYELYFDALRRDAGDVASVTRAFERFRVLCALREGPRGVVAINQWLSEQARAALGGADLSASPWYPGRPVMVLRNDPLLKLFNGDIGITLPGARGEPMVHFADAAGGYRALPALRLPAHETAYAMTVHKAQGSEFDEVLILLPAQRSRVLTRELLYTALTRARRRVVLAAVAAVVAAAVESPTERQSGLLARLRDAAASAA
jgi:exodeoxyribonuclease V alpha subunit